MTSKDMKSGLLLCLPRSRCLAKCTGTCGQVGGKGEISNLCLKERELQPGGDKCWEKNQVVPILSLIAR